MVVLTPGSYFLLTTVLPLFLGLACLIHTLFVVISWQIWSIIDTKPFLLVCIYIFLLPFCLSVANRVGRLRDALSARRLRARVIPRHNGKLWGNIDLVYKDRACKRTHYLGEPWLTAMKDCGKTFTLEILGDKRIYTMNPENIRTVLATDYNNYRKGIRFTGIMKELLGDGIFNSDGDMWRFHRKMTRPFFSKERITEFEIYERTAALILDKMQERFDDGLAVDFQDIALRFTLDSTADFLLGTSINSLDPPLPLPYNMPSSDEITRTASTRFAQSFASAQVTILGRLGLGKLWPLAEILKDKMRSPMVDIRGFIEPIVRNAVKCQKSKTGIGEDTFLEHLIDITDDMQIVVDQILNIMVAGRDTTASLLTFVVYCLATHPEVLARLRDEISAAIGSDQPPSHDNLHGMKYLKAVLNETLRLFPPIPFNMRESINETTWVDDHGGSLHVPANTPIVFSVFHLQRSEEYWGEDAHIFDPDRWLDHRSRHHTSNPFIFLPFLAGPRICLGRQFAYHETSYLLVRLLQRFPHIELAPEFQAPETRPPESWKDPNIGSPLARRRAIEQCVPRSHLSLYVEGGLWIRTTESERPNTT